MVWKRVPFWTLFIIPWEGFDLPFYFEIVELMRVRFVNST